MDVIAGIVGLLTLAAIALFLAADAFITVDAHHDVNGEWRDCPQCTPRAENEGESR